LAIVEKTVAFIYRIKQSFRRVQVIRVWDLQSAAPVAVLQGHSGTITAVEVGVGKWLYPMHLFIS